MGRDHGWKSCGKASGPKRCTATSHNGFPFGVIAHRQLLKLMLKLVRVKFGDLKRGHVFLARMPGWKKMLRLRKTDDTSAVADSKMKSTMLYQFAKTAMVTVWRWKH